MRSTCVPTSDKKKKELCDAEVSFCKERSLTQKEIHNNVVPNRVQCLGGAALHHHGEGAFNVKVFVLLGKNNSQ